MDETPTRCRFLCESQKCRELPCAWTQKDGHDSLSLEPIVRNRSYTDQAKYCRALADEFVDRSERPFLLKVAEAFDDLARRKIHWPETLIGPPGELLTLEKLPATNTPRWTPRRKAEVVAAVAGGLLTVNEACQRYLLSIEEFMNWQRAVKQSGLAGLRVTRIQEYRDLHECRPAQQRSG